MNSTKDQIKHSPAIVGNNVLPAVYSEQERIMIRNGWCVAYNTWWKHKDEGLDFRQMETKLIEALESSLLNGC